MSINNASIPKDAVEALARADTDPQTWAELEAEGRINLVLERARKGLEAAAPALRKQGAEEERRRLIGEQIAQSSDGDPQREFPEEIGIERLMRRGSEVDFEARSAERAKSGFSVYAGADLRLYVLADQAILDRSKT